jgi:membrane protease YdiL (CAAX protease family)
MTDENKVENKNPFPFNNLLLIKGITTGNNSLGYYLLGITAAVLGYVVSQSILIFPLITKATNNGVAMETILSNPNVLFNPDVVGINRSLLLALMMSMFACTLLFFYLTVTFFQKKTLSSILTGFEKIRWNRYFFSFSIWGTLIIILTVSSYFLSPETFELKFDFTKFSLLLIVSIIFIPIQTATEELLFRGYLMQGFGIAFKNGILPLIITSIMFGLMHGTNPEVKTHGLLVMMPYYILFGAFLGVLTLLDEGSELAMGIHCANNLISALLISSKNSVLQTDAMFFTSVENPFAEFLSWIVMAIICFFILFKKYKLSNWNLILK